MSFEMAQCVLFILAVIAPLHVQGNPVAQAVSPCTTALSLYSLNPQDPTTTTWLSTTTSTSTVDCERCSLFVELHITKVERPDYRHVTNSLD